MRVPSLGQFQVVENTEPSAGGAIDQELLIDAPDAGEGRLLNRIIGHGLAPPASLLNPATGFGKQKVLLLFQFAGAEGRRAHPAAQGCSDQRPTILSLFRPSSLCTSTNSRAIQRTGATA